VSGDVISAVTLAAGATSGAPLRLDEPLSFWGGLDPTTGLIIDRHHPQQGENVAGRVLMMPAGRGSSSGSASLAEAIRLGVGPAAILMLQRDPIVIVGAMVAAELYGRECPVLLTSLEDWDRLADASRLTLEASATGAKIAVASAARPFSVPARRVE
jgi:predicted aconitase with swiveling domain